MLIHLSIRNLALIESLELELDEGLLSFTGETGAGKSVIFNAISLLLGGRASVDAIRQGADEGRVQGIFALRGEVGARVRASLVEAGFEVGDEVFVRRVLSRSGRHRAWISDMPAPVSLLAQTVGQLVEVLGQHQHLAMVDPEEQRVLIDRWARPAALLEEMEAAHRAWKEAVRERRALETARADRAERLEFLRFQRDELRGLNVQQGEYDELEQTLKRAQNAEKLRRGAYAARSQLYDASGSALEQIGSASLELRKLSQVDESLEGLVARLDEVEAIIGDIAHELNDWTGRLDAVGDLDALQSRHQELKAAMRRFGADEDGLLEKIADIGEELSRLENLSERMEEIEAVEQRARAHAESVADRLDAARREAAAELFTRIGRELDRLAMTGSRLELAPPPEAPTMTRYGWDTVHLLFSANAGEAPLPIARVASGGELSRLMLAIKRVLMERDPVPTCLFDEVDTGIGGQAAIAVGEMLREVAAHRQVLCISHLPQIASRGHAQYLVAKDVQDGRTLSSIRRLDEDEREREIARMLGGVEPAEVTMAHARQMLRLS